MSIDWFTFAAQIVNFLILVGLLRWFLYGPIVRAMEQREVMIAARMQQAEQSQDLGESRADEYQQKIRVHEEQREATLVKARQEADEHRKLLTKQARQDVQRKRQEWFRAFELERTELLSELQRSAGSLSAEATRRTLMELADESLEQRMFSAFTLRLQKLDDQRRDEIKGFLSNGQVFVRSAFEISNEWQDRLRATVRDEFGYEGDIDFEQSPDLICGIELAAGGYGFGWNVIEFLRELEAQFDERLKIGSGNVQK